MRILLVLLIITICFTPLAVMADDSVTVTITADPAVTTGILNFTITYISETQLDLSWAYDAGAVNIMIRSKWNGYPDDIPDSLTTPSDGVLVYYGNGVAFSDTSMNFDDNLGTLYYKAWAQKADGSWFTDAETGTEESEIVTLIALFGLGCAFGYFAIKQRSMLFAIISSAVWLSVLAYTRMYPIGEMTTGDASDTAILLALLAAMVGIPLVTWQFNKKDSLISLSNEPKPKVNESRRNSSSRPIGRETPEEYEARLYRITHQER